MFTPSRAKIEAAQAYLDEIRTHVRGWKNTRGTSGYKRTGKALWRQFPKKWHAEADSRLQRLVMKFWAEHGRGPSQQKYASLVGNVVDYILHRRITHSFLSHLSKRQNAKVALSGKYQPNPFIRTGFTPRTDKARKSVGNLVGI